MVHSLHNFSIPVMGTGHSIDSPIRVGPYGIDSVISVVDDLLVERIRKHYCRKFDLPYENIGRTEEDGRARRITAYLNTVKEIVRETFDSIKNQPFFESNDKVTYFELLPGGHPLKQKYEQLMLAEEGTQRDRLSCELSRRMRPGSIDVNIMAGQDKLHQRRRADEPGVLAALRGPKRPFLEPGALRGI